MNKRILFISIAGLLSLIGCVKEPVQQEDSLMTVSVDLATVQTKTCLGEVEDGRRQVYWSPGDAISLNGYESLPLTDEQAGKATAEFLLYNGSLPYKVIYPASICCEFASDGTVTVNVPSSQEYSSSSFGKGAAILYGYSESEDEPVILHNLCAAVKVSLNSASGISVSKAAIISNSAAAPIAGKFIIDPKTGQYNVSEGLTSINLNIEEVSLEGDGEQSFQSFYFTVPYGEYPEGFTVKFYDSDNYPMECRWLANGENGVKVEAGKLYEFKPVDFVPGKKEILSGEDWKYIAEQINAGNDEWKNIYLDDDNTIKLGNDIVLPKGTPRITKDFIYELDGKGYTITNPYASGALIKTLPSGGVIRNLTMAGEMNIQDATKKLVEVSAFVYEINGGKIEDCVNEMAFNVDAIRVIFGAFARKFTVGELKRCVNKADMTIKMDLTSDTEADPKSFGGGLVANCFQPKTGCPVFDHCVNEGDITISVETGSKRGLSRAGFAGVLGSVELLSSEQYKDCYPILKNCTNRGNITLSFSDKEHLLKMPNVQYSLGGIVGLSAALSSSTSSYVAFAYAGISDSPNHYHIHIDGCTNEGRINNNAISHTGSAEKINSKIYTGGIAGALLGSSTNHAKIKNCTNTGEVVPYSVKVNPYSRASICGVCGGFLGLGGYVDIEGGVMNAKVGTAESRSFATAGVIGLAVGKFSVKNMSVNANISMIQSSDYTENNHALAVTNSTKVIKSDLAESEISNCAFSGSFLTICSGKYNDKPEIPREIKYVTAADFAADGTVTPGVLISGSYTKGGITMTGNTYWSNVNAQ